MHPTRLAGSRAAPFIRVALSYYVTNGLSAAVGLFLISGCVRVFLGSFAAAAASLGVIVVVPCDQPSPRRGKFWQLSPSVLIGVPLFYAVRALHADPLALGLVLVPATFMAFLGAAWGRRGVPVSISAMFAVVFALAVPAQAGSDAAATVDFALGAAGFLGFATAANSLLNTRYRVQMLADTLLSMAALMRTQARAIVPGAPGDATATQPIGQLLRQQAAFADQVQNARDLLLESPRTSRRQQLAGILLQILELRDQLLACELDADLLAVHEVEARALPALGEALDRHADSIERVADALLVGRLPAAIEGAHPGDQRGTPADDTDSPTMTTASLVLGLTARVESIGREIMHLVELARREAAPDLSAVSATWRMFISPTSWSWHPLTSLWHWDAPPLRHAIRAALAIATAYGISLLVPWRAHAYWILLTIVVVLRGSLAQTLERRNSRVLGTLLGSVLAGALLSTNAPATLVMIIVTLAQGIAHAFAVRRYLVTAIAATVLAILQAHLLNADMSPVFQVFERIADTIIGVGVAWAFSYVLPAWERTQIPALVTRALRAQARHAQLSLQVGESDRPDLDWRLARREAYDSLSALVQAAQRCLAEPRAVRPPLEPLEHLLAHSYQLLAQLTAAKTLLLLRAVDVDRQRLALPLESALQKLTQSLQPGDGGTDGSVAETASPPPTTAEPLGQEVTPWLLRRLRFATDLAASVRQDSQRVLESLRA